LIFTDYICVFHLIIFISFRFDFNPPPPERKRKTKPKPAPIIQEEVPPPPAPFDESTPPAQPVGGKRGRNRDRARDVGSGSDGGSNEARKSGRLRSSKKASEVGRSRHMGITDEVF